MNNEMINKNRYHMDASKLNILSLDKYDSIKDKNGDIIEEEHIGIILGNEETEIEILFGVEQTKDLVLKISNFVKDEFGWIKYNEPVRD